MTDPNPNREWFEAAEPLVAITPAAQGNYVGVGGTEAVWLYRCLICRGLVDEAAREDHYGFHRQTMDTR